MPSPGEQVSEMAGERGRCGLVVGAGPRHLLNLPEGYRTSIPGARFGRSAGGWTGKVRPGTSRGRALPGRGDGAPAPHWLGNGTWAGGRCAPGLPPPTNGNDPRSSDVDRGNPTVHMQLAATNGRRRSWMRIVDLDSGGCWFPVLEANSQRTACQRLSRPKKRHTNAQLSGI